LPTSSTPPTTHVASESDGPGREDDAKRRLLDAAGPVFAQHGFDGATVRQICRQAGVNIAAVGYYFGDKLGLYRAVFRAIRTRCHDSHAIPKPLGLSPREELHFIVSTMVGQMLSRDDSGWESQLMMREMNRPTEVFYEMVEESFRPVFDHLIRVIGQLSPPSTPVDVLEKLALSVVGQCVYYRVGSGVVRQLIPEQRRLASFDIDSLARHITAVTIAAAEQALSTRHCETLAPVRPFNLLSKANP
jgi:AcrR family transcriptional regulator